VKVTNICYYKFLTSTPGSPSRRPLPGRPLRRDPQEDQAVQRLVGQVWPVALSLPAVRPWRAATRICQVMSHDLLFNNFSDKPRGRCYDHNFLRFFPAKKLAFVFNTNVTINFFQNLALFRVKNANFFAKFFGENI
jgi:hypothetical protein